MRRVDDEPGRPDGAGGDRDGRRHAGRLLVPLVIAGAAVVVLSTALEGQARVTPFASGHPDPIGITRTPAPDRTLPPVDPAGPGVGVFLEIVLATLAGLVALVVIVVALRLLVAALRTRRRRTRRRVLGTAEAGAGPEVADAPAVLRGIAAALVAFDEHREPGDAVVRAWIGLQQAAEVAGFARSASETPTEFTGRVLVRSGADRTALQRLLRLYLRARFDDGVITVADAEAARDALRALEASWERADAVQRS